MSTVPPIKEGQVLIGSLFSEPMRVETVRPADSDAWIVGLVGTQTERFRNVTLTLSDIQTLRIRDSSYTYTGDGNLLRLGVQAYTLGIAYEFDPYFGLSISRVDPLPHQLEAIYDHLLKLARVRFLLADDAGAGKTIMAGLLIRELKLRGLAERILIVCPANLTFQWQRELKEKFDEKFLVLRGDDIRDQFGVNQWLEQKQVLTSLDLAKRTTILPGLRQVRWDLVVVDEAHRMSASDAEHKSQRYRLGEFLRDTSDHLLLLTATPHKGIPENFSLFLQLLDQDAYADVRSIQEAMNRRHAPFYLRRTKEAMFYFPERQADGKWVERKIFTKRIPHTVDFKIDGQEDRLYREVTAYVKAQSHQAAAQGEGNDARARAVGFLMALYQRRLASSTYALRRSLHNRARRLEEGLKRAQELARLAPLQWPDPDELEEMEESQRERLEEILEAVTLAQNPEQVREEIEKLKHLTIQAEQVEQAGVEAKLSRLKDVLQEQGFFDHPDQRLLLFTEFKDTLDYLVKRLMSWSFRVGFIHGGMKPGSRDEPGSRLYAEQQFKDGAIQMLVATEAAGEGINLQCCHILFNYDIPWNPNRLEQRMGRIHRYGQVRDCLIFNFVATNTVEGRVLRKLLEKLQEIRDALDDDAVFNVVGEILPASRLESALRDYYAGRMGDADLEERLLHDVQEQRFREICQHALEGLASKKLNLDMLLERRARAQERRVVPETIARFMREVAPLVPITMKVIPSLPHTFEPGSTPQALRRFETEADWTCQSLANRYPRLSTDRETAELHNLEWVTPGHPLFESLRRHAWVQSQGSLAAGAGFYSLEYPAPARIDFYRARIVDGLGYVVHERLFAVQVSEDGTCKLHEPSVLGNLQPAPVPQPLPAIATSHDAQNWLHQEALTPFLEEVRAERLDEVDRVRMHVELSLQELLEKEDRLIGRFAEEAERGVEGAAGSLKLAEDRHAVLLARREKRRQELERQRSLTLQSVERMTSILVLPHPERNQPEVKNLRPDPETEAIAMRVVIEHEQRQGRTVTDVHEKDLGYDITSLDTQSGELRLIEVKGIGHESGTVCLTPNEKRVAEDRRDCYWLYIVTHCKVGQASSRSEETAKVAAPQIHPIKDPARLEWHEVKKVDHYYLSVNAMTQSMTINEGEPPSYGGPEKQI